MSYLPPEIILLFKNRWISQQGDKSFILCSYINHCSKIYNNFSYSRNGNYNMTTIS